MLKISSFKLEKKFSTPNFPVKKLHLSAAYRHAASAAVTACWVSPHRLPRRAPTRQTWGAAAAASAYPLTLASRTWLLVNRSLLRGPPSRLSPTGRHPHSRAAARIIRGLVVCYRLCLLTTYVTQAACVCGPALAQHDVAATCGQCSSSLATLERQPAKFVAGAAAATKA